MTAPPRRRGTSASPITGQTAVFTLIAGEYNSTIDAGLVPYGSIGDFVWDDLDSDGIQDPLEPGLEAVDVFLYDSSGGLIDFTSTGFDGYYEFPGVIPGDYYVEFGLPFDYQFTLQDAGGDDALDSDADSLGQTAVFSIGLAQFITSIDAGLIFVGPPEALTGGGGGSTQTATLSGRAFADADADGIRDNGERGLAGLIVYLLDSNLNVVAKTFTGKDGAYVFKGVAEGSYCVRFVQPDMQDYSGFSPQSQGTDKARDSDVDINGLTAFFTLLGGMTLDDLDAGLVPLL
ncbi:MAG: SdrD B-like domain-containing protein [Chloroflexota bacterium]